MSTSEIPELNITEEHAETEPESIELSTDAWTNLELLKTSSEVDDEQDGFYTNPLFNIEHSQGFKHIDNLLQTKKIDQQTANSLANEMKRMHEFLMRAISIEKNLAKKCAIMGQEIITHKMDIDKEGTRKFLDNSTIGEKRRELIRIQNEVNLEFEKELKLREQIKELEKEQEELNTEIQYIQKQKTDALLPDLLRATKELQSEIGEKKNLVVNIERDLNEKRLDLELLSTEKRKLETERDDISKHLANNLDVSMNLRKQKEMLKEVIRTLMFENQKQDQLLLEYDESKVMETKRQVEKKKAEQNEEYENLRDRIVELEQNYNDMLMKHETSGENIAAQEAEKVRLTLSLQAVLQKMKRDTETLLKTRREKDVGLKNERRLVTIVNHIRRTITLSTAQQTDLQQSVVFLEREEREVLQKIAQSKKTIDAASLDCLRQNQMEKEEQERVEGLMTANKAIENELSSLSHEYVELTRKCDEVKAESAIRSKELIRIQNNFNDVKNSLKIKDEVIADSTNECAESYSQLQNFIRLYDVIKAEKNKYFNMFQAAQQQINELEEKLKIMDNETNVLHQEATNKDEEFSKKLAETKVAYVLRDAAKNEYNKYLAEFRQKRNTINQNVGQIERLNALIATAEQSLYNIQRRFSTATNQRNFLAKSIIDRNDELCVLHESLNQINKKLDKQKDEICDMEAKIRNNALLELNLRREIVNMKSTSVTVDELNRNITTLEIRIKSMKHDIIELSDVVENPKEVGRARFLKSKEPNELTLVKEIEALEEKLAANEEKMIEKQIILEEVNSLTDRLQKQTSEGRILNTEIGNKLNKLTQKIRNTNKSLMAKASELAMVQSKLDELQKEKKEKEECISLAERGMETGEISLNDFEKDLLQAQKRKIRREQEYLAEQERKDRIDRGEVEIDSNGFYILKDVRTKAEPRPTAYLPDITVRGELPVPKAYNASFAPYRPQELKNLEKYYKIPTIKPIEI